MSQSIDAKPYGSAYRLAAIAFCFLLGLAMIVNNELAGEATWFWYTTLFHAGTKLYADLHLAMQPLFILELNVWMKLFGRSVLAVHTDSVLHLLLLCMGLVFLTRESDWPDWQRGLALASAFVLWIAGGSYRFDDYHVTTESFVVFSLVGLLILARTESVKRQLELAAVVGLLGGLIATSRVNDGAAMVLAVCLSLLALVKKRKLLACFIYLTIMALTILVVVRFTGDTFRSYLQSTLIRAAGSKGGSGSIFAAPFLLFGNSFGVPIERKWIGPWLLTILGAGVGVQRYWKNSLGAVVGVQLGIAAIAFAATNRLRQSELLTGTLVQFLVVFLTIGSYLAAAILIVRFVMWSAGSQRIDWDPRETLVLVPLGILASISTSAAASPLSGYYAPLGMLLLLFTILHPYRKQITWLNGSLLTMFVLLLFAGTVAKVEMPYFWNNQKGAPMFTNREWYRHPVYGPMYIERDQLQFSIAVCNDVNGIGSSQELLSLPFSYANYFCADPPWHKYVQTFFDISTRETMDKLLEELRTAPPQWIVYQRQLGSLAAHEKSFNHGRPLAQRDLDTMIMQNIANGHWALVDRMQFGMADGWYIVRTRP